MVSNRTLGQLLQFLCGRKTAAAAAVGRARGGGGVRTLTRTDQGKRKGGGSGSGQQGCSEAACRRKQELGAAGKGLTFKLRFFMWMG